MASLSPKQCHKRFKTKRVESPIFRIFDKQDTSGNQQGVANHIRVWRQTLYLAEHVLRTNKIIYFGCYTIWFCIGFMEAIVYDYSELCQCTWQGNHMDINIGVHLLDWEKSVKKDLQRYGFELVGTNGKENRDGNRRCFRF